MDINEFNIIVERWVLALRDEGIKLKWRELLRLASNYPNYIVSIRYNYDLVSDRRTYSQIIYLNYTSIPVFMTSDDPDLLRELIIKKYVYTQLHMTGQIKELVRNRQRNILSLLLRVPLYRNVNVTEYYIVRDPTIPAELTSKYITYFTKNEYWGSTSIYTWNPNDYVPEAIERLKRRTDELCQYIPSCKLAMLVRTEENKAIEDYWEQIRRQWGYKQSWLMKEDHTFEGW